VPINSAFSLIKSMTVKSAGKTVYEADNIQKVIFITNVLDYSDDSARGVAKSQFWNLDSDATNVTAAVTTNFGIRQRGLLSHGGAAVETHSSQRVIRSSKNCLTGFCPQCRLSLKLCRNDFSERWYWA